MGAECFLVKKSLCPLRFWVKYSQWMKSCRGWTILTKKSWGSGRFHRENVKGVDIFKEKTCQGCTFSYFLFFFSLRTPIHLSTFWNLLFSCFLCNMNMLLSGYILNTPPFVLLPNFLCIHRLFHISNLLQYISIPTCP